MEARYRAAGDGNEQEGKQASRPDRAGSVHELSEGRHPEFGRDEDDADGQADDGADLEEGGQIVARHQEQPDRQHGGNETVADQQPGQLLARQGKEFRQGGISGRYCPATIDSMSRTKPIIETSPIAPGRIKRL